MYFELSLPLVQFSRWRLLFSVQMPNNGDVKVQTDISILLAETVSPVSLRNDIEYPLLPCQRFLVFKIALKLSYQYKDKQKCMFKT